MHAASLQDPTYTSAYYTSAYPGIYQLNSINNNGLAIGEQDTIAKNQPAYGVAYDSHTGSTQLLYNAPNPTNDLRLTGINNAGTYVGYRSNSSFTGAFRPS